MPPSRSSDNANTFRINRVFHAVGSQPTNRRLTVLNLRRKQGLLAEPVLHTRNGVTVTNHADNRTRIFVSTPPPAAMNVHNQRHRFVGRLFRQIQVELLRGVAIRNVR
jgi:hypothetical protein